MRETVIRAAVLLVLTALTALACQENSARCVRDKDCSGGQVCADGVCSVVMSQDSAPLEAGPELGPDAFSPADSSFADGGDIGGTCPANQDGKIQRAEMLFTVPSAVTVTQGTGLTLDLQGTQVGGKTQWDLTQAAADDKATQMKIDAVTGWATSHFKGATYQSALSANFGFFTKTDLLGVFKVTPTALQLMGAASTAANHTRFTYTTPLETVRFPMAEGVSYVTQSEVKGIMEFAVPVWLQEKYTVTVLKRGTLKLYANFALDTLLVSVKQEVHNKANPLLKSKTQVYLFMAECYGVVARVISKDAAVKDLSKVVAKERWKLAAP